MTVLLSNLAGLDAALGQFNGALRLCDEALTLIQRLQRDRDLLSIAFSICARYAEAGRLEAMDEVLSTAERLGIDGHGVAQA